MNSLNFSTSRQEPLPTRVVTDPTIVLMCDVAHTYDKPFVKKGDIVTLVSAPKPYGFSYVITYFVFAGERGFFLDKVA